jgi:hypothetical protein
MGLTGIALYYIGFNLALTYTSASQGALVQSSIPADRDRGRVVAGRTASHGAACWASGSRLAAC